MQTLTLEQRVATLEQELRNLKRLVASVSRTKSWQETFAMFKDDPDLDRVLELGRKFREMQDELPPQTR
ncbi:MAG: hypothetical protein HY721_35245 [Planctomycetes bacterium]|nr:hypothetical protein [Planctomycetota bacterium]